MPSRKLRRRVARRRLPAPEQTAAGGLGRDLVFDFSLGDRAVFRRGGGRAGDHGRLDAGLAAVQVGRPACRQINASAIDDLTARVAALEAKGRQAGRGGGRSATARIDALEKSLAALRGELVKLHAQSDKLASADQGSKPASARMARRGGRSERDQRALGQIERASRAQSAEMARTAKPADDMPLRRVVAAALLDVAVRQGHPVPALLATAKSLAPSWRSRQC